MVQPAQLLAAESRPLGPGALKDICSVSLLSVDCSDEDLHTPVHSNHAVLSTPTDTQI